jgi:hypothetical protein
MKKLFFVCLLLSGLAGTQTSTKLDWVHINNAWETYINYPSSETADSLIALLPETWHPMLPSDELKTSTVLAMEDIGMLERQVYARDRSAVRLAFRMLTIADGVLAEELCIILGSLIRIDPELFLEELNTNRSTVFELGPLVNNFGHDYVDRFRAQELECKLRIQSLKKIDNPVTAPVRDTCILHLEENIRRLQESEEYNE